MRDQGKRIITELEVKIEDIDTTIPVEYKESGDFEFSLKLGGDLLIFHMQSNVITFRRRFSPDAKALYTGGSQQKVFWTHHYL